MTTEEYSAIRENFRPRELLWHYTGFKGLEGILNGTIWASSAFFLNDVQEFRYAVDIAMEVLQQERAEHPGEFDEAALSIIDFFRGVDGKSSFVTSFSKKGDDLSQWRGYGGGGPSFAIGFDPRQLSAKAGESKFDLVRVVYGRAALEEAFRADLHRLRENFQRFVELPEEDAESDPLRYTTLGFEIIAALMPLAAQCKHESFENEDEWRLVRRIAVIDRPPRLPLKFRVSGSLVVPYVEIPLHEPLQENSATKQGPRLRVESPVVAINIGPSPHPDALEHAIGEMAALKGLSLKVGRSTTPFRNW